MPDVCGRLLTAHRPADNMRCRACTVAGTGLPGERWPCTMHNLATAARALHGLRERSP
jgi:hypothetical protein